LCYDGGMPVYDFKCLVCGSVSSVFLSMGDESVPRCVGCGGETVRVFGFGGVSFNGSGFYSTDK
jgi:putative FmdB family regulatory protein